MSDGSENSVARNEADGPDTPEEQHPPPRRRGLRRLLPSWRAVLGTLTCVLLLGLGAVFAGYLLVDIPSANASAVAQGNVYLYSDGSQLARTGTYNRENVRLDQVSLEAQHAVLAAEDRDFYTEAAIDPGALVRAAWNTVTGKGRQGGSTITQQYVKNYYLGQEQTVARKVQELFIAVKLDRRETKDEILEGYLNTSYFGRRSYGIQAAAHAYYGKDAAELTTAEGAYLASLLQQPSAYDVVANPQNKDKAVARWNYALDGMVKEGWLEQSEREAMEFPEPRRNRASSSMSGQRGYLVEAVNAYMFEHGILDEQTLESGGFRITTTIDRKKNEALVETVEDVLLDKLDPKARKVDSYVRAGAASVDPATGKVVAMYGGRDFTEQYVNNATRHDYQVGSTFKPFVLAAAVHNGSTTQDGRPITPNTVYDGTNKRPVQPGGYVTENQDNRSYGNITVTEAANKSVNTVFAQMGQDVGPDKVVDTAVALGLPEDTPDLAPVSSVPLGVAGASVTDMAGAYAALANHGEHTETWMVQKVTRGDEELDLPEHEPRQAVSRKAADTTTSVLRSVVSGAGGTGAAAQALGRPAAGKTGTAEEDTAAWFAGYTPQLATVVSIMGQDPDGSHKSLYGATGLARINGGGYPAQIWAGYMTEALRGEPVEDFDLDVVSGPTEAPSGTPSPSGSSSPTETEPIDTPTEPTDPGTEPEEPEDPGTPSDWPSIPVPPWPGDPGGADGDADNGGSTGGRPGGGTGGDGGPGGDPGGDVSGADGGSGGTDVGTLAEPYGAAVA
ncbi:penicillin-binding protein [Streptomyces sp. SCUT-3]|uniref:transglycosylase domain-containing protein n=1 Tax=Streptomyces sp. SCUT-3 TaxID=2684469 RepID=UPI0015F9873B|nr:transglycosylase domain-containing protein [Streptomyces sp. SCUT-3]QMV23277.1 penicillin-binding protein [Streptomyces sp. SCUT-3]